ncbi:MAG: hypothetical protein JSU63_14520 [Phycisphaerales bacterium]|nr:MAG: hypothetical protein JSU63_14520 [Phycisphaerales bacterium]
MSAGEIAGLVILSALLGAGVAGLIIALRVSQQSGDREAQQIEAYARWLAACLAVSRASLSFVAAFRALAAERRESAYFELRKDEAQRARAHWCDVLGELDRAEAVLRVWHAARPGHYRCAEFHRVRPDVLRSVINGTQGDFDRLSEMLRNADKLAVEFACAAAKHITARRRNRVVERFHQTACEVKRVVDGWGSKS